jgi:hypothetical protein
MVIKVFTALVAIMAGIAFPVVMLIHTELSPNLQRRFISKVIFNNFLISI